VFFWKAHTTLCVNETIFFLARRFLVFHFTATRVYRQSSRFEVSVTTAFFFRTKPPDQKSKRRAKTETKNKKNTTISCAFYTPRAHHPEAVVKLRKLFFHLCSSLRVFCIKLFHALPNHRSHLHHHHHHLQPTTIAPSLPLP